MGSDLFMNSPRETRTLAQLVGEMEQDHDRFERENQKLRGVVAQLRRENATLKEAMRLAKVEEGVKSPYPTDGKCPACGGALFPNFAGLEQYRCTRCNAWIPPL